MEKTHYEKPEVTKINFKFEDAIAASTCSTPEHFQEDGVPSCVDY